MQPQTQWQAQGEQEDKGNLGGPHTSAPAEMAAPRARPNPSAACSSPNLPTTPPQAAFSRSSLLSGAPCVEEQQKDCVTGRSSRLCRPAASPRQPQGGDHGAAPGALAAPWGGLVAGVPTGGRAPRRGPTSALPGRPTRMPATSGGRGDGRPPSKGPPPPARGRRPSDRTGLQRRRPLPPPPPGLAAPRRPRACAPSRQAMQEDHHFCRWHLPEGHCADAALAAAFPGASKAQAAHQLDTCSPKELRVGAGCCVDPMRVGGGGARALQPTPPAGTARRRRLDRAPCWAAPQPCRLRRRCSQPSLAPPQPPTTPPGERQGLGRPGWEAAAAAAARSPMQLPPTRPPLIATRPPRIAADCPRPPLHPRRIRQKLKGGEPARGSAG